MKDGMARVEEVRPHGGRSDEVHDTSPTRHAARYRLAHQCRGRFLVCRSAHASTRPKPTNTAVIKVATIIESIGIVPSF